jgi:hypothetical protein
MTAYERQILETETYYDAEMAALEDEDIEILSSVMGDSRLHEILHNPDEEGIAEG